MVKSELPILYVIDPSVAVTGAFIAVRNSARALKDSARMVLVLPKGSSIAPAELADFWRVEYVPMAALSKNLRSLLQYLPTLIAATLRVRRCMQKDGATRLQLNDFYLMHGVLLRLMGFRGQIISWVRCHPARFAGPLARPMLWLAARSANRLVAVSNTIRLLLPIRAGAELLYDGYAGPTRSPRRWQAADEKIFVYVGNYIAGKGQDTALEAFARIAAQDATLKLTFYGGDMGRAKNKTYRAKLEHYVMQHGLTGRVTFHDFLADTYPVLEHAYAALNFSAAESFSMTVLEASGAGVAVIATASGGPQEIIADGVTGILIPVGDVTAAAEQMLLLARDFEKAVTMGEAGAQRIRMHFSLQQMHTQLQRLWGFAPA